MFEGMTWVEIYLAIREKRQEMCRIVTNGLLGDEYTDLLEIVRRGITPQQVLEFCEGCVALQVLGFTTGDVLFEIYHAAGGDKLIQGVQNGEQN